MAAFSGAEIVNDGLVFHYDMANTKKSWKGKPTINLITNPTFSSGSISPWTYQTTPNGNASIDSTFKYDGNNSIKIVRTSTGGESNVWLNLSAAQGLLPNTQYTFSAYCFSNNSSQAALFSYFGTTSNGFVYHSGSGNWERLEHTFTTRSTEPYIQIRMWHNTTLLNSPIWFTNLQVEQSSFATPFVDGTRSNTQAILDLTGNNTVTANSLTYNSDNTFDLDGTSNYFSVSNFTTTFENGFTYFAFFRKDSTKSWSRLMDFGTGQDSNNILIAQRSTNNTLVLHSQVGAQSGNLWGQIYSSSGILTNSSSYQCIAATIEPGTPGTQSTGKLYYNGSEVSATVNTRHPFVPNNITRTSNYVGKSNWSSDSYWDGHIPTAMIYNRRLTAAEIKQNFEAIRSRYNI